MTLALPILYQKQSDNLTDFIAYWSQLYAYGQAEKYAKIHKNILSTEDLTALYEWKNGMKLSEAKAKSLTSKIIQRINIINDLKAAKKINMNDFLSEFKHVSAVWKLFLLHIIQPDEYPIYDQHIHRAYSFIKKQSTEGIKSTISDAKKLKFYFEEYLPFVKETGFKDLKKMDEAFFAFGQFIHIGHQKTIVD